jgi:hypothetical protein
MPKIIDYAYNFTTATNGTTIVCDVPSTQTGDLLLAVITADSGTMTFSNASWQAVTGGAFTNTVRTFLMWRISTGASEPTSYTFTATAQETFNATMISIRDVDTVSPFISPSEVTRTASNTTFPSITTNRNNSLILYISTHGSTAVIPSSIEGGVIQLFQLDGSAHSDSIGWTIKATSGTTSTTIRSAVSGTTFNGSLIALGIRPPSTGATLIPAYCADDLSEILDPLHGTTPFRGNTAPAGTAATYYTSNIDGRAVANATLTARADTGINSFRSTAGQNSSINRTWVGIAEQFASARTNLAGKNILCHVGPLAPIDMQTLEGVGLERGVAMGMHTSIGNFKVWHVHGANTSFGEKRTPVIVNTLNTTGLLQTTGTFNQNSIQGFGFFVSGFITSADMIWAMLWALDTTTVAGGNSTTPVDIPGIVSAISNGHERISALQQGDNQMLCLQPFQLGDGTLPTYLNISSAAIEFPRQYNLESQSVFYNSVDNVAGVTFHPASGDYFDLRSSTWSSSSKFHWRWASGSSSSATILTSGMQIIGSGDVQLRAITTFDDMSFTECTSITQNSAVITDSSFTDSYLFSNTPNNISNSSFTSTGTGHAIEITATGTYDFVGNTFTGYGLSGTTNAAIYNNSGGLVTLNISGGGSTPTIRNGTGASTVINNTITVTLTGLKDNTEVRIYRTSSDPITEVAGIESATNGTTDNRSFAFSDQSGNFVDIVIVNLNYQIIRIEGYQIPTQNTSIPIQQVIDRNYINP